MKLSSKLIWQEKQHRQLFKIIDEVQHTHFTDLFLRLSAYIEQHFSMEEEYMKQTNFPDTEKHTQEHRNFSDRVLSFISHQEILDDEFRISIHNYLLEWLEIHVHGIDKDLEEHVLKSDVK